MGDGTTGLVTAVVTSCGRHDLLRRTLDSFLATNSGPLDRVIVVEDGPDIPDEVRAPFRSLPIEWISTGERVGQIAAIDYAYSRVDTPYIFHLEDDWEFRRGGYMERSLAVLEAEPECVQVWLRHTSEDQPHPLAEPVYEGAGAEWQRLVADFEGLCGTDVVLWRGFSFNPGLRRLRDYVALGGYGANARFDGANPGRAEWLIGEAYFQRGYHAAILVDEGGTGYATHIGWGRRVPPLEGPGP